METIVGRLSEKRILNNIYLSKEAELVAVYGRRRVGKTYLIKHYFQSKRCVYFHITGIKSAALNVQLERYNKVFCETFYPDVDVKPPENWMGAFDRLTKEINKLPSTKKVVLFFDELPWLANRRSGVLSALEYFWNRYWVDDKRLKLVLCGSSSSWMINKIIKNRAGLHNRVTKKIKLLPLTLRGSQLFLAHQKIQLSEKQMLRLYMATGGIPYYLKQIDKCRSVDQNINELFFNADGLFFDEFEEVFFSLFDEAESYKELVKIVASSRHGILRNEIEKKNKLTGKGGYLTKRLNDLESAGFITSYLPFKHKRRGTCYRIADEYCYFYLQWIEPIKGQLTRERNNEYWLSVVNTAAYHTWTGYAFENICYKHVSEIKQCLKIPQSALSMPWYYSPRKNSKEEGAQIDLLFDRLDSAITLCEIKYSDKAFSISKQYAKNLLTKKSVFQQVTQTQKQVFIVMVCSNGLKQNCYVEQLIDGTVNLAALFAGERAK